MANKAVRRYRGCPRQIPPSVRAELTRLNVGTIKVLGGTSAISASVEAQLAAFASAGLVTRFSRANRYATAAAVAEGRFEPGVGAITVATGENFPDALAGGPAAAARQEPLLPPPLPAATTVADIVAGKVPVGDQVLMTGQAIRRIDQDDYMFNDGTGKIRIDIQDDLNQNIPVNTCMTLAGVWDGREVEVDAYAACVI